MKNFSAAFLARPTALLGLLIFVAIALIALAAPLLFAHGPFTIVGMPLLPPGVGCTSASLCCFTTGG